MCIRDRNYAGLADLALSLIDIEGGAYVGGQLKAVVDGFGPVEQGGPFSVIWNSTGADVYKRQPLPTSGQLVPRWV